MKVIHQLIGYFAAKGKLSKKQIRDLTQQGYWAPKAPDNLQDLEQQIGAKFYFLVTGETDGPLWGTDVYTSDSSLGKAAVHAGILQPDEIRVIQVTIEQPRQSYQGSTRNGVRSDPYDHWPGAYSVAEVG